MSRGFVLEGESSVGRRGLISTNHGEFGTPAFMPVGTIGSVKAIDYSDLAASGASVMLANTYHLMLRPGLSVLADLGGLHRLTANPLPILTDSGGFQVMSLSSFRKITDEGVEFASHLDGSRLFLSPEEAVRAQNAIGSDIQMALDVCPASSADDQEVSESARLSLLWAKRTLECEPPPGVLRFGIGQGGMNAASRAESTAAIAELPFDGFAIGGLSVGEPEEKMFEMIEAAMPHLPADKPRYLMGVGKLSQIRRAIAMGVDIFDCVLPTRVARHGLLWTTSGEIRIARAEFARDALPLDEACSCHACRRYSRAYLHHLERIKDPLYLRLASLHNLTYLLGEVRAIRDGI